MSDFITYIGGREKVRDSFVQSARYHRSVSRHGSSWW